MSIQSTFRCYSVSLVWMLSFAASSIAADLSPLEELGKRIFFDENLSSPVGQSCASCHAPETGFSGPDSATNKRSGVYQGAMSGRYGNRKPPSAAYASFSPRPSFDTKDTTWVGGQFWDGRADDLKQQAKGPFLNPLEMNNESADEVVAKVRQSNYRQLFAQVFGQSAIETSSTEDMFDQIAEAIAAYESSAEVNAFSSKYDLYLAGKAKLTEQEIRGLKLFSGKANCSACHPHEAGDNGAAPLFTDFTYDNVGAPRNKNNPFYRADPSVNPDGAEYRDLGLGAVIKDEAHHGKVKVPTLRNVAKKPNPQFVKAYLHNGTFKSLKEVVQFYNRRDVESDKFGAPDVETNVNREELGNLKLTEDEENDLLAFLETLSDGYASNEPETSPPDQQISSGKRFLNSKRELRGVNDLIRVEQFRSGGINRVSHQTDKIRR